MSDQQPTDELRQQLLESIYGLLSDDEAVALDERIGTDPAVAAAHAEARQVADLLAASARLVAAPIELAPQHWGQTARAETEGSAAKLRAKPRRAWRRRFFIAAGRNGTAPHPANGITPRSSVEQRITRAMRRTAAIAAALLAAVTLGAYLVTSWPLVGLDGKHVRLVATGPQRIEPGIDNLFTINTSSPTGRSLKTQVNYVLKTADGKSLVPKTEESTDRDGRLTLRVRPELSDEAGHAATLEIALAQEPGGVSLAAPVSIEPAGLTTQLALDKPIYQPGEVVRFRSLTLTRFGLNPPSETGVEFEMHDPSGAVVPGSALSVQTEHGVGYGAFPLRSDLAGGEYTLVVHSTSHRFADEKRSFFVRSYRLPRLKKDLEFTRDSYAPGDHVVADLSAQRTEGNAAAGAKLHAVATIDGQVAAEIDAQVGPAGTARIEFDLPSKIERGAAQLAVAIDDGGNRETVAKSIRINLDRVEVSFYPEGGDLVPGLENRVYFTARDPLDKPAHVDGRLVDSDGREVAHVVTTYKGMGLFKLTPAAGASYSLKAGQGLHVVQHPDSLVSHSEQRVVLSTGRGVFEAKQPLAIELQSNENDLPLIVGAYCRGVQVGQQAITAHRGTNHVEIPLPSEVGGVVRITVFEQAEAAKAPKSVAERLVYRWPERALNVRIADHKPRFSPGDPVELSLAVTNERGEPTPAVLGVSVAPDSLLKMIDDEIPSMPTHFYLMTEIAKPEDLEKADFYLSDDPQAPAALDLLLGTQGWRRFAEKSRSELVDAKGKQQVDRLAAIGEAGGPPLMLDNRDEAMQSYRADLDRLEAKRADALSAVGRYELLAAVPLGLLLLFFAAWGSLGGVRFWVPTVATAGACFVAAWIWSEHAPKPADVAIAKPALERVAHPKSEIDMVRPQVANLDWQLSAPTQSYWLSPPSLGSNNSWFNQSDFYLGYNSPRIEFGILPTYQPPLTIDSTSLATHFNFSQPVAVAEPGTMTLTGNNTYAGGTNLNGGTLTFNSTLLGNNPATGNSLWTKTGSGILSLGTATTYDGQQLINSSSTLVGRGVPYMQWRTINPLHNNINPVGTGASDPYVLNMTYNPALLPNINEPTPEPRLATDKLIYMIAPDGITETTAQIAGTGGGFPVEGVQTYPVADLVLPIAVSSDQNPFEEEPPIVYPSADYWRILTADRAKFKSVDLKAPGEATARIIRELHEPTDVDFNETPLRDVVQAVTIRHNNIPILLDVKAIEEAGGSADKPITFSLKGTSLQSALRLMLQEHELGFVVDHDVLLVTSDKVVKETLFKNMVRRRIQVREYAHHHQSSPGGARTDFAETLYWNPVLITDSAGKATIKFDLSDAVAKYRVLVDAHAHTAPVGEGRIGSGSGDVISQLPISLEPKLPLEVNAGDRIDLPVAVANDTDGELPVTLAIDVPSAGESRAIISPTVPKLLEVDGSAAQKLRLPAGARSRAYFPLNVTGASGAAQLEVRGETGDGKIADAKRQMLAIVPAGCPVAACYGGNLSGDVALTVRIPKPSDIVPGSLHARLTAYPSAIGQIEDSVESILREPTGCFEQASASNYPNILALEYLQEHKLANPELTRRCKALLQSGYARLTSYESKSGGFEWFGADPGHETLTAYGLMEFHEMARVYHVDPALLKRTADWLLSRRDGNGGFKRSGSGHQFGFGSPELGDAYITWALTEAGVTGIEPEIKHTIAAGRKSEDPYIIALAAITAQNAGDTAARELLDWLVKLQAADGHLEGRESFSASGGASLQVETTALAAVAWLKSASYRAQAQRAIDWLVAARRGGGFGSTQATVLALKALVEHARLNQTTVKGGELVIKRDGQTIGRQAFAAGQQGIVRIDDLAGKLEPGENHLTITLSAENKMPYALDVSYRTYTGPSDPACAVRLSTKLASGEIKAGDTVALDAELSNVTDKPQPMTVAILGLPAGLEPRTKQLDDLKKAGTVDFYEIRPREIICYWRTLDARQKVALRLDLVAEVPGQYTAPASRAYLYYTAERKQWCEPLRIAIKRD
jgi:autotransporter-associated beta strand protein